MKSKVYFIQANRREGDKLVAEKAERAFLALGLHSRIEKDAFVALKIHFGEKGNTGFIKPEWLKGIIRQLQGRTDRAFFTDTNTLYVGMRSNAVDYTQLAARHGFSLEKTGLPVIIADGLVGENDEEVKIGLKRVNAGKIAAAIARADFLICLNHVTGHVQTGLGAAIKNMGMGCASRAGKLEQHSEVQPRINPKACKNCSICLDYCPAGAIIQKEGSAHIIQDKCIGCGECLVVCKTGAVRMRWDEDSARIQEKMVEYAYAVWDKFREKAGFVNFLLKITKDCDCMAKDQPEMVGDIGILASTDPVALDKASADLIIERSRKDVFRKSYDIDWSVQLRHGARIGLGSLDYELIESS
ncbi:MAG: DUF362 domain-containing protein [Clostridiales bacterium]|nr:DUF362 domain-containing protein [Clostridiales bacterium]